MKFYVSSAFLDTREILEVAKAADDLGYDGMAIPDDAVQEQFTLMPLIALGGLTLAFTLPVISATTIHAAAPVRYATVMVRPGDEIVFRQGRGWRHLRVVALGSRRGPAAEAQELYRELPAPQPPPDHWAAPFQDNGA